LTIELIILVRKLCLISVAKTGNICKASRLTLGWSLTLGSKASPSEWPGLATKLLIPLLVDLLVFLELVLKE
jgi:hypothetical protein